MIRWLASVCAAASIGVTAAALHAGSQVTRVDDARTQYIRAFPVDSVSRLQADIDSGRARLIFDPRFGYLPAVLKALNLSTTSQVAVFSRTSVQKELISPETPRCIYFNDSTYVAYVKGAKALEICTSEPHLGGVYYTLLQRETDKPRFFRTIDACLECHTDKNFSHLPAHIMYSSRCNKDGSVLPGTNPVPVFDTTPLAERFGGWYVTGETSNQKIAGNTFARPEESFYEFENRPNVSFKNLSKVIDVSQLLTGFSDIVALMVFVHQQRLINLISNATYELGRATAPDALHSQQAGRSVSSGQEPIDQVIQRVCEPVVAGLLFADEAKLNGQISGGSGYATYFAGLGPHDHRGRSLRTFDLKHRMFRYPCSYLIYSENFDALPVPAKRYIYRRLWEVLTGRDRSGRFTRLTQADRKAITEILTDTKPEFDALRH